MAKRQIALWGIVAALMAVPAVAGAQDDLDDDLFSEEETSSTLDELKEEQAEVEARAGKQQFGEDRLAVFELDRGFYMSSDLGFLISLGNVQGYSNLQPFVSVRAGYDLTSELSIQGVLSMGYISQNPISSFDDPTHPDGWSGRQIASFDLTNLGAEAVYALRPLPRLAIEPKIGAGLTLISPSLTDPANPSPVDGLSPIAPHVSGGVDFKYLTLMTDFTAGVSVNSYFILVPGAPIFAISGGFVVRYTFS